MTTKAIVIKAIALAATVSFAAAASAAPLFSVGAVVSSPSNTATFNALNTDDLDLGAYQENGIAVTVPGVSFIGFDPFNNGTTTGFHYAGDGNDSWVDIRLADGGAMTSLDFLLGDGFGFATTNLIWETFSGNTSTGFGDVVLDKGSTVGWTDAAGFTRLRIAANGSVGINSFGEAQAIALDNLRVSAVPEPATFALFGSGLFGIWAARRKARAVPDAAR
jgi:hypothetical protein